jgi:hypothetical protein
MRLRLWRWSSWLAVAALLLHTGTVARHSVIQIQAAQARFAQFAALEAGIICHIETGTDDGGPVQSLPGKNGSGTAKPCPVCLGLASAYALSASEAPQLRVPLAHLVSEPLPQGPELARAAWLSRPPNRGPPSSA